MHHAKCACLKGLSWSRHFREDQLGIWRPFNPQGTRTQKRWDFCHSNPVGKLQQQQSNNYQHLDTTQLVSGMFNCDPRAFWKTVCHCPLNLVEANEYLSVRKALSFLRTLMVITVNVLDHTRRTPHSHTGKTSCKPEALQRKTKTYMQPRITYKTIAIAISCEFQSHAGSRCGTWTWNNHYNANWQLASTCFNDQEMSAVVPSSPGEASASRALGSEADSSAASDQALPFPQARCGPAAAELQPRTCHWVTIRPNPDERHQCSPFLWVTRLAGQPDSSGWNDALQSCCPGMKERNRFQADCPASTIDTVPTKLLAHHCLQDQY